MLKLLLNNLRQYLHFCASKSSTFVPACVAQKHRECIPHPPAPCQKERPRPAPPPPTPFHMCHWREGGQISGTKVLQNLKIVVLKYYKTC
jgi:hypothetical protein